MTMYAEPARLVGAITAAVTAIIALLVAYGLDISESQQAGILGVVAVAAPLIAALVIRGNVYAPDTAAEMETDAYKNGLDDQMPAPTPVRRVGPAPESE